MGRIKRYIFILAFLLFITIPAQSMELTSVVYDVSDTKVTIQFMVVVPIISNHPVLYLEYGVDQKYGQTVPIQLKQETLGGLSVTYPATIEDLTPGTKYHFHLVIKDKSARINIHSLDSDFTTATKKKESL
jgi:hypothetical protein